MKPLKFLLLQIIILMFSSCHNKCDSTSPLLKTTKDSHYMSIDGLWKCTKETALQLQTISLESVIKISGSIFNKLTVQGCFLLDGQFMDYWGVTDIQFNDSTNQITIHDEDGSTFIGIMDDEKQMITGMVYSGVQNNLVAEDKLDFVRATDINVNRLFTPHNSLPDGSIRYTYRKPEHINDGLQNESIFQFIKDSSEIYNLMERVINQEFGRIESFLILKDQKLVLEEYFYAYDRTQLHNIHSCTKSVTSLLAGIALEQHGKMNVDKSISSFFPQYDSLKTEEKKHITLRNVLTMTTGLQENEKYKGYGPDELLHQIFSLPLESKPSEQFNYNSECPNILGGIIYSLEGLQVDEYAKENLFEPLRITNYDWHKKNGVTQCHSDLYLLPRDMAKIGLLVLNDGKWLGQQIISKKWIKESIKPHVKESEFFNYGYQWWHRSKQNKVWWKESTKNREREHDMILALGYGGQYIFVIRDLNIIVVMTASDYNEGNGMALKKVPMVIEEIVPLFKKLEY